MSNNWTDESRWYPRLDNATFVVGRKVIECLFCIKYEICWIETGKIQRVKPSEINYYYDLEGIKSPW